MNWVQHDHQAITAVGTERRGASTADVIVDFESFRVRFFGTVVEHAGDLEDAFEWPDVTESLAALYNTAETVSCNEGEYRNVYDQSFDDQASFKLRYRGKSWQHAGEKCVQAHERLYVSPCVHRIESSRTLRAGQSDPEEYQATVTVRVGHPTLERSELRRWVKDQTKAWTVSANHW